MPHLDPLIDAERELDRRDRISDRANAAYLLLEREFEDALYINPEQLVSNNATRNNEPAQLPAVALVSEILAEEEDHHTLVSLLRTCAAHSRTGSTLAEGVINGLCSRYAAQQMDRMLDDGAFNDE